jgi:hypothetical protein
LKEAHFNFKRFQIIGIFQMQLFRDVDIPLRRFRGKFFHELATEPNRLVLMHNQALSINQLDLMDSSASLVDYYDQHNGGGGSNGGIPDYRSRGQLTEDT